MFLQRARGEGAQGGIVFDENNGGLDHRGIGQIHVREEVGLRCPPVNAAETIVAVQQYFVTQRASIGEDSGSCLLTPVGISGSLHML
jgi:hypothetical protein